MRYRDIDELRECSTEQLQGLLARIDRTKPSQREFERRVRAEQEGWSKEAPTVEGWYWFWSNVTGEKTILEVIKISCGFYVALLKHGRRPVSGFDGLWKGPLSAEEK